MKKKWTNYIIDMGLLVTFILSFFTGVFKWPALLPKFGISYKQLPMSTISFIHDWSALVMSILVIIHIILHWDWIVTMTKKLFEKK